MSCFFKHKRGSCYCLQCVVMQVDGHLKWRVVSSADVEWWTLCSSSHRDFQSRGLCLAIQCLNVDSAIFTCFHIVTNLLHGLNHVKFWSRHQLQCENSVWSDSRSTRCLWFGIKRSCSGFLLASKSDFMLLLQMFVTVCSFFPFMYSFAHYCVSLVYSLQFNEWVFFVTCA